MRLCLIIEWINEHHQLLISQILIELTFFKRKPEVFLVSLWEFERERRGSWEILERWKKRTHRAPVTAKSKTMYICILCLWQVTHRTQPSPEDNLRNVSQYWLGRPSPPPPVTRHPMWHTRGHTQDNKFGQQISFSGKYQQRGLRPRQVTPTTNFCQYIGMTLYSRKEP